MKGFQRKTLHARQDCPIGLDIFREYTVTIKLHEARPKRFQDETGEGD